MEAVDAGVGELTKEKASDKKEEADQEKDSDDESTEEVQETTFDNPSPEEIKQLQAEPKKLSEKKLE